jgi:NADH:ubiquinone oxidoreductase subunit H
VLFFAALMLLVPAVRWTTMWILALGTFAALFALATRERAATMSFALAVGATLTVMLVGRTASIAEIVAAQGPQMLRWYLFQSPASSLAFVAYLVAVGAVCGRARISAALFGAPAAVLGAALFLGGWPLGGSVVAIGILGAKAAGLLVVAQVIRLSSKLAVGTCLAGLALALLSLVVDLGVLFPQWSALAVGGCCALGARAMFPPLRRATAPLPA